MTLPYTNTLQNINIKDKNPETLSFGHVILWNDSDEVHTSNYERYLTEKPIESIWLSCLTLKNMPK